MNNHQRLKFAYARGARIQFFRYDDYWHSPGSGPSWSEDVAYRIHPDDAHLEYGPISTAMRKHAINGYTPAIGEFCEHPAARNIFFYMIGQFIDDYAEEDSYRMQWLFLAEVLADEGL